MAAERSWRRQRCLGERSQPCPNWSGSGRRGLFQHAGGFVRQGGVSSCNYHYAKNLYSETAGYQAAALVKPLTGDGTTVAYTGPTSGVAPTS